jgi:hypothetical protein
MKQSLSHINIPEDQDLSDLQSPQTSHAWFDLVGRFEDEDDIDDDWIGEEDEMAAENIVLPLPSSFRRDCLLALRGEEIAEQERELRIGQANDSLELLRDALASKSLIFRTEVRNADSQRKITRSWGEVEKVNVRIRRYVGTYRRTRAAMINLDLAPEELAKFQVITPSDLKMSSDVVEENRVGQRNDKMAWFWSLGRDSLHNDEDWMDECECYGILEHIN